MDIPQLKELVTKMGKSPKVVNSSGRMWVMCSCPFAPWLHTKGRDSSASFGICEAPSGLSIFNCYACKEKGTLEYLFRRLAGLSSNNDWLTFYDPITELVNFSLPSWEELHSCRQEEPPETLDESYLTKNFKPLTDFSYPLSRGVSIDTCKKLDLMWSTGDGPLYNDVPRVVFPIRGPDGSLHGATGRAVLPHKIKQKDFYGTKKGKALLGIDKLKGFDSVVLVEGPFDYACLREYGIPAVACLHADLTAYQIKILQDVNLPVYLMLDNDKAGRIGERKIIKKCSGLFRLVKLRSEVYPEGSDPASLSEETVKRILDDIESIH